MNLKHNNQGTFGKGLKIGDVVEIASLRLNWFGIPYNTDNAYSGYIGKVIDIWENGSFALFNGSSTLVVPAIGPRYKTHIGIKINGRFYFYYFAESKRTYWGRFKSFLRKLVLPLFYKII